MNKTFFFDRRRGNDRRKGREQRQNPRLDLTYRRRRSGDERRNGDRSKVEDVYASGSLGSGRGLYPRSSRH